MPLCDAIATASPSRLNATALSGTVHTRMVLYQNETKKTLFQFTVTNIFEISVMHSILNIGTCGDKDTPIATFVSLTIEIDSN